MCHADFHVNFLSVFRKVKKAKQKSEYNILTYLLLFILTSFYIQFPSFFITLYMGIFGNNVIFSL